jgi:hypothetical protein
MVKLTKNLSEFCVNRVCAELIFRVKLLIIEGCYFFLFWSGKNKQNRFNNFCNIYSIH